jgi:hypothetical protein
MKETEVVQWVPRSYSLSLYRTARKDRITIQVISAQPGPAIPRSSGLAPHLHNVGQPGVFPTLCYTSSSN